MSFALTQDMKYLKNAIQYLRSEDMNTIFTFTCVSYSLKLCEAIRLISSRQKGAHGLPLTRALQIFSEHNGCKCRLHSSDGAALKSTQPF